MPDPELVGLQEIATLAGVTPSAVANWRRRFLDFPEPIAELKSGPVFRKGQILLWLSHRQGNELGTSSQFYEQLAGKREDDTALMRAIEEAASKLRDGNTT